MKVYFPPGHYLGCRTSARDACALWTYDPTVPEADCRNTRSHRPDVDWRLSASQIRHYDSLAKNVVSPISLETPSGEFSFDSTETHSATQAGVGAVFHANEWLAIDAGVTTGTGSVSQSSDQRDAQGQPFATRSATFRIFTGDLAARFYPVTTRRFRPWLSAGIHALALQPTGGSQTFLDRTQSVKGEQLLSVTTGDVAPGIGFDLNLTPRIGIAASAERGFRTGWQTTAALIFKFPRPPGPTFPRPGSCGDYWPDPDCPDGPFGPFGPRLPFPFTLPGTLHNQALDATLADLQSAAAVAPARPRTREELLALVDASAHRFLRSLAFHPAADAIYAENRQRALPGAHAPELDRLSEAQQRYLREIDQQIAQAPDTAPDTGLEDLGQKALRELGPSQAQPVLVAASVAAGSLCYWRARTDAWDDAIQHYLGTQTTTPTARLSWENVTQADVEGGVAGAVTGAAGGVVEGGVAGAVAGAVVGGVSGAVGGSLGNLIGQLPFSRVSNLPRIPLSCVFRGGRHCSEPGWSCLVMFPESQWPFMREQLAAPSIVFTGNAAVQTGPSPVLRYEFASPPAIDRSTVSLDREVPFDPAVAESLGFKSVTVLPGDYAIDRSIGAFGGIAFNVRVAGISDAQIGVIHNEAMRYLYTDETFVAMLRNRNGRPLTMGDVETTQVLLREFLLRKGFDRTQIDDANERARALISDAGLLHLAGSVVSRLQRASAMADNKGALPKEVAAELTNVFQMAGDGKDVAAILAYVDTDARRRLERTCNARYANVFIDVSLKSKEFWTGSDRPPAAALKPGSGVILADGAGALYGLLAGPVFSIIEATLFSFLANEAD